MDMEEMEYQIETLRSDVITIRSTVDAVADTCVTLEASRTAIIRADDSMIVVERLLSDVDDMSNRLTVLEGMIQLLSHEVKMLKEAPGFVVP